MNNPYLMAFVVFSAALSLLGCDQRESNPKPSSTSTTTTVTTPPPAPGKTSVPGPVPDSTASRQPDNTANNHPDRATSDKTPMDQSEKQSDITITATIRKEVLKQENMSTNGQNCKIITSDGVVTLRGPVNSQTEKDTIETIARKTAGVTRVDSFLEVKTNP